jgi:hypothetical protein
MLMPLFCNPSNFQDTSHFAASRIVAGHFAASRFREEREF